MEEDLKSLIKANKIFSSLDDSTCQKLLHKFTKIELKKGEVLFAQGDPSDNIYVLVHGKLSAHLTSASGATRVIGYVDAGESVGESGALTSEPRSLTLVALKDSTLLKLPSKDFIDLCHLQPSVMFAAIHPMMARSRSLIQLLSAEKVRKHIVVIPANKHIAFEDFYERLMQYAETFHNLIILKDTPATGIDKIEETLRIKAKIAEIEKAKKSSHRIIYLLNSSHSPLAKIGLKKSDLLYVVAHSKSLVALDKTLLERIDFNKKNHKPNPNLILLHPEKTLVPKHTSRWLTQATFDLHHHVRMNTSKHYHRLLRFMRGKPVGLVLSGGGTRGWAHLGAIKALHDSKIPIDMIGGTSVGAILAGCYAIHESIEDAYERFYRVTQLSERSISLRNLTWPSVSLFSAKNFTKSQMEVFGNIQIEDLWIPYFCVSCNLANNTEHVHRSGTLWERTRASSSIPGIIPPMLLNGELHLDGGLLNNLPIDIVRDILGKQAKVVAVELNSYGPDDNKYDFPPILTFKQGLLAKLGLSKRKYIFPRFVDMFLRGLFLGSTLKSRENSLTTNLLLNLDLSKFRLLHSNIRLADKIMQIGYEEAMKQINQQKTKE